MASLRTKKSHSKYKNLITKGYFTNGCKLCKEIKQIKEFRHWRVIYAKFPWDLISKTHHILIPKRHVVENKLTRAEKKEFESIKQKFVEKKYELIIETTTRKKSIPEHFHLHLIVIKD